MARTMANNKRKMYALEQLIKEHLEAQYIEESTSPLNSPVFVVKKKSEKLRIIMGLTAKNKVIL